MVGKRVLLTKHSICQERHAWQPFEVEETAEQCVRYHGSKGTLGYYGEEGLKLYALLSFMKKAHKCVITMLRLESWV